MDRRNFLAFLGLAPAPIVATFHKAADEGAGIHGILKTDSFITSAQAYALKQAWGRRLHDTRDGEKIIVTA